MIRYFSSRRKRFPCGLIGRCAQDFAYPFRFHSTRSSPLTKQLSSSYPSLPNAESSTCHPLPSHSVSIGSPPIRCFQREPVQKLHGDERFAVLVVGFVDRADVRMIQCRSGVASRWKWARACVSLAIS